MSPRAALLTSPPWLLPLLSLLLVCCGGTSSGTIASATEASASTSVATTTTTTGGSSTTFTVDPPLPHQWTISAEFGEEVGSIFSIWADGPETILAVGGQPLAGVLLEYKDGSWTALAGLPESTPRLNWIHGIGELRVVVGYFGALLHREGGVWQARQSGVEAPLWGVWGAAVDDLWAVGSGGGEGKAPTLLHYDGEVWSGVDVAAISGSSSALYKIWGRAADDIYAVGAKGLILHYNGVNWLPEETPVGATLIGISGDQDGVVVAGGRSTGVVLRRVDGKWKSLTFPGDEGFDGVMLDEQGRATVVGRRGFISHFASGGGAWVREESGVDHELHSVYGVPGGPVFAVGGHFDSAPYTGVILRREPR